jgi:mRNA interferase YafQ
MRYHIVHSKSFRKAFKRLDLSRGGDLASINMVFQSLQEQRSLSPIYKDHQLQGLFSGCRECHIKNDLLLIYRVNHELQVIVAIDIGSHSQLFG